MLWIKRVVGVCGDLWWVSGCFRLCFGLSGQIFGSWKAMKSKTGWETWIKRGELRGFCGQFAVAIVRCCQRRGVADLQNIHNKMVAAKIFFINELAADGVCIPTGRLLCF